MKHIDGEVDWNIELGTIARLLQGPATGPSVLFNNIKDYNKPNSRCKKVFTGALANYRRIAMMMGLPPDTHPREFGEARPQHSQRRHSAENRADRCMQGKHRQRR